jgi:replicative DNA helicase
VDVSGEYKDPNEALQQDRGAFTQRIKQAEQTQAEELKREKVDYLYKSAAYSISEFIDGIHAKANTPSITTGFTKLDSVLDGGLYEGLYIVGAISSLGKTTLITQIGDQIAQSGQDILLFSLEMAKTEIMAKSISRQTLLNCKKQNIRINNAKTVRGVTDGKRWKSYSQEEKDLLYRSAVDYGGYATRIFIHEGVGSIGATEIRNMVGLHKKITGESPVVIIDYLQILAPYSERATDKQNTDKAVMELKRISRDYKIPVIGISSFNRQSYKDPVTMEAFKESGAIEYSSDVLIGLQLKGVGGSGFNVDEAKGRDPRQIELKILKNRNGRSGDTIAYEYYPAFNYFQEA